MIFRVFLATSEEHCGWLCVFLNLGSDFTIFGRTSPELVKKGCGYFLLQWKMSSSSLSGCLWVCVYVCLRRQKHFLTEMNTLDHVCCVVMKSLHFVKMILGLKTTFGLKYHNVNSAVQYLESGPIAVAILRKMSLGRHQLPSSHGAEWHVLLFQPGF